MRDEESQALLRLLGQTLHFNHRWFAGKFILEEAADLKFADLGVILDFRLLSYLASKPSANSGNCCLKYIQNLTLFTFSTDITLFSSSISTPWILSVDPYVHFCLSTVYLPPRKQPVKRGYRSA